ncbi:hypothetical protein CEUSTIGMA_g12292.t1 [Chlamydomonas eustigma]|uniref:Uncharacterized protein n=1 Tax=Chlamydomonas eustigma TaxID=1157962 RepID=A0A250XP71_9CHLO|nr:hypothetical protein CEUSTIGMA_g12292.t1 [Chlamydomonas eustigma]|eukprot:GAX84871.1 hypothetical protein CEUSTIGMA_g12292.t1 [Chlamydomonas eustigma]
MADFISDIPVVAQPSQELRVFDDPDFWVYYQPITLSNLLTSRQPLFLRRNLRYSQKKKPSIPKGTAFLQVTLNALIAQSSVEGAAASRPAMLKSAGHDAQPLEGGLTLMVAVCEGLSNGVDFKPVTAQVIHVDSTMLERSDVKGSHNDGVGLKSTPATASMTTTTAPKKGQASTEAVVTKGVSAASSNIQMSPVASVPPKLVMEAELAARELRHQAKECPDESSEDPEERRDECQPVQIRLQIPVEHELHCPHLVMCVWDSFPNWAKSLCKQRSGKHLSSLLDADVALGVLRPGSTVWSGTLSLAAAISQLQIGFRGLPDARKHIDHEAVHEVALRLCTSSIGIHTAVLTRPPATDTSPQHTECSYELRTLRINPISSSQPSAVVTEHSLALSCDSMSYEDSKRMTLQQQQQAVGGIRLRGLKGLTATISLRACNRLSDSVDDSRSTLSSHAACTVVGRPQEGLARQEASNAGLSMEATKQGATRAGDPTLRKRKHLDKVLSEEEALRVKKMKASTSSSPALQTSEPPASQQPSSTQGLPSEHLNPGQGCPQSVDESEIPAPVDPVLDCSNSPGGDALAAVEAPLVQYRFMFAGDQKMAKQCEPAFTCCMCNQRTESFKGLQQHLEASHLYLKYEYFDGCVGAPGPQPAPGAIAVVVVRVPLTVFCRNTFRLLGLRERSIFRVEGGLNHSVVNTFIFHKRISSTLDFDKDAAFLLSRAAGLPLPLPLPPLLPSSPLPMISVKDIGAKAGLVMSDSRQTSEQGAVVRGKSKGKVCAVGRTIGGPLRAEDGQLSRRYYHSRTAVPMTPEEVLNGQDTDDETDMEGVKRELKSGLAASSNKLTVSERELITYWNCFTRKTPAFADYIIPTRCCQFVKEHKEMLKARGQDGRRSLVTFLLMLWEYSLIDAKTMDRCFSIYDAEDPFQDSTLAVHDVTLAEAIGKNAEAEAGSCASSPKCKVPGAHSGKMHSINPWSKAGSGSKVSSPGGGNTLRAEPTNASTSHSKQAPSVASRG